jgi:hypothetical protein
VIIPNSDSVLALDPNTGKIKWYYQWTPNDTWDYDGANEVVMTDLAYGGVKYQATGAPAVRRRSHPPEARCSTLQKGVRFTPYEKPK